MGDFMKAQNLNLIEYHFSEALEALKNNQKSIEKSGDTILVLEDGTRVLVIYRMNTYLFQNLDKLL